MTFKTTIAVALLALCITGCSQKTAPTADISQVGGQHEVKAIELTATEKIKLLRAEAKKRKLSWYIHCADWLDDPNRQFAGRAYPRGSDPGAHWIEEGAPSTWFEMGATEADTAYLLYVSIQGPANIVPPHRPAEKSAAHKQCPPELRGE